MSGFSRLLRDAVGIPHMTAALAVAVCPALPLTSSLADTLLLCVSVIAITALSCTSISFLRKMIPVRLRPLMEVLTVSFYVSVAVACIRVWAPDAFEHLVFYVGLCSSGVFIFSRLEKFSLTHRPLASFLDGLFNALGYSLLLAAVALLRMGIGAASSLPFVPIILLGFIVWLLGSFKSVREE